MKHSKAREARPDKAISSMVDLKIQQPGGELLGTVDEFLVETRSGRISYVIARCGNGERKTIPWRLLHCAGNEFRLHQPLSAPVTELGNIRRRGSKS